jgi:hypothetical protein
MNRERGRRYLPDQRITNFQEKKKLARSANGTDKMSQEIYGE